MTEDTHAQANAEQVRVLREALEGTPQEEDPLGLVAGEGGGLPASPDSSLPPPGTG